MEMITEVPRYTVARVWGKERGRESEGERVRKRENGRIAI